MAESEKKEANIVVAKSKKSDLDKTLAKVVKPVVNVTPIQAYGVYQGEQIVRSCEDEGLAHSVANRLKADSLHRGMDIDALEHRVEVRTL